MPTSATTGRPCRSAARPSPPEERCRARPWTLPTGQKEGPGEGEPGEQLVGGAKERPEEQAAGPWPLGTRDHRHRAASQHAELPVPPRQKQAQRNGAAQQPGNRGKPRKPERGDIADADPHAKQRHTGAQQRF